MFELETERGFSQTELPSSPSSVASQAHLPFGEEGGLLRNPPPLRGVVWSPEPSMADAMDHLGTTPPKYKGITIISHTNLFTKHKYEGPTSISQLSFI